jgi:hypothetical protein
MEISNEYLVGNWTASSSIIYSLSTVSWKVKIYLVSANKESESVDFSNSKITPKKPAHKSI